MWIYWKEYDSDANPIFCIGFLQADKTRKILEEYDEFDARIMVNFLNGGNRDALKDLEGTLDTLIDDIRAWVNRARKP